MKNNNMIKKISKISQVICAGVLVLAMTGCGNEKKDDNNSAPSNDDTQVVTEADATVSDTAAENEQSSSSDEGYTFTYNGVEVTVDEEAAPVITALGTPKSEFQSQSCAFDGYDRVYTYSSFEIDTYSISDVDYVSMIILRDDLCETAEHIAIGSSRDDVISAYGENYTENGTALCYQKGDMHLNIILENDEVVSIEYVSNKL